MGGVNVDDETNLHKTYDIFDKIERVRLELGVLIGGILIPAAAWFRPQIRASRFALFFPAAVASADRAVGALLQAVG